MEKINPKDLKENDGIRCFRKEDYHTLVDYLKNNDLLNVPVPVEPTIAMVITTVFVPFSKSTVTAKFAQRYKLNIIDFENVKFND